MMKTLLSFRIAAAIFVLFALGHTYGFLRFSPSTVAGQAVKSAMDGVTFPLGNAVRSYGDLYRGFGLMITAYLLFSAALAWQLPRLTLASPESFRVLSSALVVVQLVSSGLSLAYFALPQSILSIVTVACLVTGTTFGWSP